MENSRKEKKFIPYLLPIRCILLLLSFVLLSLIAGQAYTDISKWWTSVAIVVNILTIGVLYFYCRKKEISYKQLLGYEKGKTKVKSTILIVFVILAVGMGGLFLAGLICYGQFPYLDKIMVEPIPLGLAITVLFILPITTTLAEDGLYLGYAINQSQSKWAAIIPAAIFYALQHSFVPFLPDGIFILYRFISFLPLTFIMCAWYQKNRNPVPFMIGHFILNIATAVQILIMTISPDLYGML